MAFEKDKIRGAIRTDFILSGEIVVITLGTVAAAPFGTRIAVLSAIAAIMTVGVYGMVATIVKLDDLGLHLAKHPGLQRRLGLGILSAAPYLTKGLSLAGTGGAVVAALLSTVVGIVAGALVVAVVSIAKRVSTTAGKQH